MLHDTKETIPRRNTHATRLNFGQDAKSEINENLRHGFSKLVLAHTIVAAAFAFASAIWRTLHRRARGHRRIGRQGRIWPRLVRAATWAPWRILAHAGFAYLPCALS